MVALSYKNLGEVLPMKSPTARLVAPGFPVRPAVWGASVRAPVHGRLRTGRLRSAQAGQERRAQRDR